MGQHIVFRKETILVLRSTFRLRHVGFNNTEFDMKIKAYVKNDMVTGYSFVGTYSENDLNIEYGIQHKKDKGIELDVDDNLFSLKNRRKV